MMFVGLILTFSSMAIWWRDVVREGTFEGHHTVVVQEGLRHGVLLFIVSEVMFFLPSFGLFLALVLPRLSKLVLSGHQKVSTLSVLGKYRLSTHSFFFFLVLQLLGAITLL